MAMMRKAARASGLACSRAAQWEAKKRQASAWSAPWAKRAGWKTPQQRANRRSDAGEAEAGTATEAGIPLTIIIIDSADGKTTTAETTTETPTGNPAAARTAKLKEHVALTKKSQEKRIHDRAATRGVDQSRIPRAPGGARGAVLLVRDIIIIPIINRHTSGRKGSGNGNLNGNGSDRESGRGSRGASGEDEDCDRQ